MKTLPKGTELFSISKGGFDQMQIESFYSGSGLFFERCAVLFTDVFEREEAKSFILEKINWKTF